MIHNNIGKKSEIGVIADEAPCIIAIMGNQKAWKEEAAANARLIAAAPELLEATKRMINWLEGVSDEIDIIDMALQARAAIAKAEGN